MIINFMHLKSYSPILNNLPNQENSSPNDFSRNNCGIATAENPELAPIDIDTK